MRRALIVTSAILVLFATSAVMAGEQQVSDRLLEILKERQIISENEYAELSDIADQMKADQTDVDQRLSALDTSISEYLAKEGDEAGVATKHKKGTGFGFATGNFELWVGGRFQFEYFGITRKDAQDTNNFRVKQARFYFQGKAFVEGFTYKFQWEGNGGVTLRDAYGNYVITKGVQIRAGQFKVPYSRQELTSSGKLQFMNRSIVTDFFAPGRDVGIMGHNVHMFGENPDDMALEWALGFFNGDGTNVSGNDNNWLGWAARLGFYPMGFIKYGETNFAQGDLKAGIAASYVSVRNRPFGTTVKNDAWQVDLVVTIAGLYFEGEYHSLKVNPDGSSSVDFSGWFVQAGYLFAGNEFEVMGRYSFIDMDRETGLKNVKEWVIGAAWYPEGYGHPFKIVLQIGELKSDTVNEKSSSPSKIDEFDYSLDDFEDAISEFATYLERTRFIRLGFQLDW
jgi:phosphate-selective porin OprO/OprP